MSEECLPKVKGYAVAMVTLEISLTDVWGSDCVLSQIHKQGVDSALAALHLMVSAVPGDRVRLVGKPTVSKVIVLDESTT